MAIPSVPSNFILQAANGNILASWDSTVGATSYDVQRSTDNITFSTVASAITATQYMDTTGVNGTQYWFKVRAKNGNGDGAYTAAQSVVPTQTGEMTLGQIRLAAQQRADRVNSNFITVPEWNSMINQAMFELYDLLVTNYEDYFAISLSLPITNGQNSYTLPDGTLYNKAAAFYKLIGVDLAVNTANNAFVSVPKFNFLDRNKYIYPNTASTIYGVFNLQYRLVGNQLQFIPIPSSNQTIRIWYIPRMTMLLADTDVTSAGISGWMEYVIVRAAYLALAKEESDTSQLVMQLAALQKRIEESAMNRDAGVPDKISDIRQINDWGGSSGQAGWSGPIGGM